MIKVEIPAAELALSLMMIWELGMCHPLAPMYGCSLWELYCPYPRYPLHQSERLPSQGFSEACLASIRLAVWESLEDDLSWSQLCYAALTNKLPIFVAYNDKGYFLLRLHVHCREAGCSAHGGHSGIPKGLITVPEGKDKQGLSHSGHSMLQLGTDPGPFHSQLRGWN